MREAWYVVGVARALSGAMSEEEIRWCLPVARGWAYYHGGRLLDGEPMMWPDRRLRKRGRWWDGVRKLLGR